VIAGNGASGLAAFELAMALLAGGKASSALALSVTAVEPGDFGSPLLDPAIGPKNRAFAFLLTTRPQEQGLRMRLSASFFRPDKEMPQADGELYFTHLIRLLSARENGTVEFWSCDVTGSLSIEKEG
jgi:hypothetical protein